MSIEGRRKLAQTRPAAADTPHPSHTPAPPRAPHKFTLGLQEQICEKIRHGNRPHVAAGMCGISSATYYAWMRAGKEGDPVLAAFADAVELACHHAEGAAVLELQNTFKTNPENLKFWLSAARPDGWAKEVNAKVQAQLEEALNRLEASLPSEITSDMVGRPMMEYVLAALAGQSIERAGRAQFKLLPVATEIGEEEADDE